MQQLHRRCHSALSRHSDYSRGETKHQGCDKTCTSLLMQVWPAGLCHSRQHRDLPLPGTPFIVSQHRFHACLRLTARPQRVHSAWRFQETQWGSGVSWACNAIVHDPVDEWHVCTGLQRGNPGGMSPNAVHESTMQMPPPRCHELGTAQSLFLLQPPCLKAANPSRA